MKLGILTFQFAHNYGAMLQCFALKKFIENRNVCVSVINYTPTKMFSYYSMNPYWAIRRKDVFALKNTFKRYKQAVKFFDFQKKELKITKKIKKINNNSVANLDGIIVGSDQVWNYNIVPDLNEYLLKKCTECNKYSYSASLGKKVIPEEALKMFEEELRKFKFVSVREKNNAKFLSEKLSIEVKNTVDPVFLLDKDEWRNVYKNDSKINENISNYVLYIDLFNSKTLLERARNLANENNLDLVTIDPLCRNQIKDANNLYNVGPLEYLELIDNAEFVVTNSFHAVAFSSIFEKRMVYHLEDELSNRIIELLNTMNISEINNIIDFKNNSAMEKYSVEISKSINYLNKIIDDVI